MVKPPDTLWALDGHTLGKHRILRGYVDAWLPIMSKWNRRLVIVDGFAGPGRYLGGEKGSPLLLLDAFLEHRYQTNITAELVYLFIEERKDRADYLQSEIDSLALPSQVKVHVVHGRYEERFGELLDRYTGSNASPGATLAPTLAFVDPFGWAQAPMDLTGQFLQFSRCEVLIYVPLRQVNRFVLRAGQENAMTSLFGGQRWREVANLGPEQSRMDFLHDLFREQMKSQCGLRFVRSFEILTADPNAGYHLFFGTNNERGLQKMKEAMWSVDPVRGREFRDSTRPDQLVVFEADTDLNTVPLLDALKTQFRTGTFTIEDAERCALIDTPYLPRHVRRTLKPQEQAGHLVPVDPNPARRGISYPAGTKVRFV